MKLKYSASFFILLAIVFCFVNNNYAQTQFEGKVTFNDFDEGTPHSMDYYAKGSKIRFDTNEEEEQGQVIWDTAKKEFMVVMPQQKMYMVMQVPESKIKSGTENDISENIKFTKTKETKKILGYTAVKLVYQDGDDKGEAWMTQELGSFKLFDNPMQKDADKPQWQKDFEAGGYFPLEVYENGKKVFEVTSIEKKSLAESIFEVPAGFKKMDMPTMH